jgi:hypothetical protein
MEITPRELTILASFARYPLLTVEEVSKLLYYSPASASYVNKLLSGLVKKKLLVKPERPHVSKPHVYYLSNRGVKVLMNNEVTATFTKYTYPLQLEHLQTTTALKMTIETLPHSYSAFHIEELTHDLILKQTRSGMRPDVLSKIRKQDKHTLLWWEIELHKDQKRFREDKIRKLILFLSGDYQGVYGEQLPTILILTTVNEHKALLLKRWLEAELESTNDQSKAYLFRVSYLPKAAFAPQTLFFKPIWRIPFQDDAVRLFDRA